MENTYYQSNEKVRIVEDKELDYIIEDLADNTLYTVDKEYFHRKYQPLFDTEAYTTLRKQIHNLNKQLGQMKNANRNKDKQIKKLRRIIQKRKRGQNKQYYKNGKRGTYKNGG